MPKLMGKLGRFLRWSLPVLAVLSGIGSAWAQTGVIEKVFKKNHARVKWNFSGAKPGQLGILLEIDLAVGMFRVLSVDGLEGTIELMDTSSQGVFTKGRDLRLVELEHAAKKPGNSLFLIWSPEVGVPILVDGIKVGTTPAYVSPPPGVHEISVLLREGGGAGARVSVTSDSEDILCLFGLQREATPRWNPSYLLEQAHHEKDTPKKNHPLQWIDEAGGTRIYLGYPPVAHPVITKRVKPIYPRAALKTHVQGRVAIEAIVGADGLVHGARVIASHDAELAYAALEAVKQWTYKPGTLEGKPVPVYFTLSIDFSVGF